MDMKIFDRLWKVFFDIENYVRVESDLVMQFCSVGEINKYSCFLFV
jgi:hypothetical protein